MFSLGRLRAAFRTLAERVEGLASTVGTIDDDLQRLTHKRRRTLVLPPTRHDAQDAHQGNATVEDDPTPILPVRKPRKATRTEVTS